MKGPGARVIGIDHIPELGQFSDENLRKDGLGPQLDDGSIMVIQGDGRQGKSSSCPPWFFVHTWNGTEGLADSGALQAHICDFSLHEY